MSVLSYGYAVLCNYSLQSFLQGATGSSHLRSVVLELLAAKYPIRYS
jgi:hypothetical protein